MEKNKIKNIFYIFLNNYDELDLSKQNKQINILLEELKNIEQLNLKEIVDLNKSTNTIKVGNLIKIENNLYCLNNFIYDKENFSKNKDKILLMELINLDSPFTYYMSGRNQSINFRHLNFEKNKNKIEIVNNENNLELIKNYVFEKSKFNQIIFSRIHFDTNENMFNLNNTNHFESKYKKKMFPIINGIEQTTDNIVSSYNKITNFDLFKEDYKKVFFNYNPLKEINCLDDEPVYIYSYTKDDYNEDLEKSNYNLDMDLDILFNIQKNLNEFEEIIFNQNNIMEFDRC